MDRFLLRVEIGYPPAEDEIRIMKRRDSYKALRDLQPVMTGEEVVALQDAVGKVHVDDAVTRYILAISQATRESPQIQLGASPRGSLALYEASQAHALVEGRDFVTPGDVKQMAVPVYSHRVIVKSRGGNMASSARERARIIVEILKQIPVPV